MEALYIGNARNEILIGFCKQKQKFQLLNHMVPPGSEYCFNVKKVHQPVWLWKIFLPWRHLRNFEASKYKRDNEKSWTSSIFFSITQNTFIWKALCNICTYIINLLFYKTFCNLWYPARQALQLLKISSSGHCYL